ncbi:MAG: hypothetical protein HYU03_06895 [Thaumarchaeota archaeon]|nr:hypothetical protein [Nitrososphaerota archaeon]
MEQTPCVENLAHVARWQGKLDEAIGGLEQSLQGWKKFGLGQDASQILQHPYLPELYLKKGAKRAADKHKDSLLLLLPEFNSKANLAYQSNLFLEVSDTADEHEDYAFETRLLKEGIEASLQDDRLREYSLYFQQCIGDIAHHERRLWTEGPGRFPHPNNRQWQAQRLGPHFTEFKV